MNHFGLACHASKEAVPFLLLAVIMSFIISLPLSFRVVKTR